MKLMDLLPSDPELLHQMMHEHTPTQEETVRHTDQVKPLLLAYQKCIQGCGPCCTSARAEYAITASVLCVLDMMIEEYSAAEKAN